MLAHHTISGCNLQPGDLLGTGTVSSSVLPSASLIRFTLLGLMPAVAMSAQACCIMGVSGGKRPAPAAAFNAYHHEWDWSEWSAPLATYDSVRHAAKLHHTDVSNN